MDIKELTVASEEQTLGLLNGYTAEIRFDPIYQRWYYNLYLNQDLVYAGVPLTPDTIPLKGFTDYSLGLIDKLDDKVDYEPYNELGSRLGLIEVTE